MNDEELMHYGVKGQKWGVRRYQKANGSLTLAGKNQYRKANKLDAKANIYRSYANLAEDNINKFSKHKNVVSKLLAKSNTMSLNYNKKVYEKYEKEVSNILDKLKDHKISSVAYYDPYLDKFKYKPANENSHYGSMYR